jgi:hypothetical protein
MLGVQNGDVKLFDGQILQSLREYLVDIAWPPDRRPLLTLLGRHATTQLEGGVNTNRTSRSYSSDTGQGGNRLGGQQP